MDRFAALDWQGNALRFITSPSVLVKGRCADLMWAIEEIEAKVWVANRVANQFTKFHHWNFYTNQFWKWGFRKFSMIDEQRATFKSSYSKNPLRDPTNPVMYYTFSPGAKRTWAPGLDPIPGTLGPFGPRVRLKIRPQLRPAHGIGPIFPPSSSGIANVPKGLMVKTLRIWWQTDIMAIITWWYPSRPLHFDLVINAYSWMHNKLYLFNHNRTPNVEGFAAETYR